MDPQSTRLTAVVGSGAAAVPQQGLELSALLVVNLAVCLPALYYWTEIKRPLRYIYVNIIRYVFFRVSTNTEKSYQRKLFQVQAHACTDPRTLAHIRTRSTHTHMQLSLIHI